MRCQARADSTGGAARSRRLVPVLALLAGVVLTGCPKSAEYAGDGRLSVYRCARGRHQVPDAIMRCVAANPKPGQVLELDLRAWEYSF